MRLIDGTYEILEQRSTGDGRTLLRATDPDGAPVRIVWYDVPRETEAAFETYRRALRRIEREGGTLLRDVVSRPGARYAVWDDPAGQPPAPVEAAWRMRLARHGIDAAAAEVRWSAGQPVLACLDWRDEPGGGFPAPPPTRAGHAHKRLETRTRPTFTPAVRTWLTSALLLLTAIAIALGGWSRFSNDAEVLVPDVVGSPANAAAITLHDAGFVVIARSLAGAGTPGTVVATDPSANTMIRPGRNVFMEYLEPPEGSRTVLVPSVAGRDVASSTLILHEAGLTVGDIAEIPAQIPADTVLAQRPSEGMTVAPGEAVHLLTSAGPRPARGFVPDLVGLPLEDARTVARLAGVTADRILVDPVAVPTMPTGNVVSMTPLPWQRVRIDDVTIRLHVADPEGASPFSGEVLVDAGAAGEEGLLDAEATGEEGLLDAEATSEEGLVNDVEVAETEEADANDVDAASLESSTGGTSTPDVVGLGVAEAEAILRDAGLRSELRFVGSTDLPLGVVLQEPAPGTNAPTTIVQLVVNAEASPVPQPLATAFIAEEKLRWVPYAFDVDGSEGSVNATVLATTVDGVVHEVFRGTVETGTRLEGRWVTIVPGPVTFQLRRNGMTVQREVVTRDVPGP